jgi:small subunit ribosomal protein S3
MEEAFDFENPQIEVNEIENPDADAKVVAKSIADWLEKGGHAKRVGYTYLRRMKEAGVIGAELEITGKLSGNRGRTEKFSFGYVKRCGNTSKENVQRGYELARTKPGAIGVKVRIMKEMPEFKHRDVDVSTEILHQVEEDEEADEESKDKRIEHVVLEAENMTSAELDRAMEETEEVKTEDISKEEIRDAFDSADAVEELEEKAEEIEEEVEEAIEEETGEELEEDLEELEDEAEEVAEEAAEEADEEAEEVEEEMEEVAEEIGEIVSGTISDAKDAIDELDSPDFDALLKAEEEDKDRKTFKEWLERQKD